jgi:hypothetical protein
MTITGIRTGLIQAGAPGKCSGWPLVKNREGPFGNPLGVSDRKVRRGFRINPMLKQKDRAASPRSIANPLV